MARRVLGFIVVRWSLSVAHWSQASHGPLLLYSLRNKVTADFNPYVIAVVDSCRATPLVLLKFILGLWQQPERPCVGFCSTLKSRKALGCFESIQLLFTPPPHYSILMS